MGNILKTDASWLLPSCPLDTIDTGKTNSIYVRVNYF